MKKKFPGRAAVQIVASTFFLGTVVASLAIAQSEAPVALGPENFSLAKSLRQSGSAVSVGAP